MTSVVYKFRSRAVTKSSELRSEFFVINVNCTKIKEIIEIFMKCTGKKIRKIMKPRFRRYSFTFGLGFLDLRKRPKRHSICYLRSPLF